VSADRRRERGQASVELVGLTLLLSLALGALAAARPVVDGRSVGGFLAHHIMCAATRGCQKAEEALELAYGEDVAGALREHAPNLVYEPGERELPVDWRRCRQPSCSNAPDDPELDTHLGDDGVRGAHRARATAFTRVIRRDGRLYLQYWLYYPDSNSAVAGSDRVWERSWLLPRIHDLLWGSADYPGFHRDDWEGVFVRIDPDGSTWVRASAHGHYQGCKWRECRNQWIRRTGWVRVSRGSHAGHVPFRVTPRAHDPRDGPGLPRFNTPAQAPSPHRPRVGLVPGRNLDERSTSGEGLRLIPLETLDPGSYRPLDEDVKPPWRKRAYTDPETGES
jgi:ribosomal protein L36